MQILSRKFGNLIDIQGWTPGSILSRKSDNSGFIWIAPTAGGVPDVNQILYGNGTVKDALDQLTYVNPSISSFNLSVGSMEVGQTVTALTATWAFNKPMISATLTDTTILPTDTTHSFTGLNLTTNKTYTLTCSDGTKSASVSRSVSFQSRRYWGVSPLQTLTDTDIQGFQNEFSQSKSKAITYDCTGGRYFYFCYPASFGLPATVTVNGFPFSSYTVFTQSFTSAIGAVQSYNIVRCDGIQTGNAIPVTWS